MDSYALLSCPSLVVTLDGKGEIGNYEEVCHTSSRDAPQI